MSNEEINYQRPGNVQAESAKEETTYEKMNSGAKDKGESLTDEEKSKIISDTYNWGKGYLQGLRDAAPAKDEAVGFIKWHQINYWDYPHKSYEELYDIYKQPK